MSNKYVPDMGTYAYNIDKKRWVFFEIKISIQEQPMLTSLDLLPSIYYGDISASGGLLCLMSRESQEYIVVCNPILKNHVLLPKAPSCLPTSDYVVMTLYTDIQSRNYVVGLIKTYEPDDDELTYKITIYMYYSKIRSWINLHIEDSVGWSIEKSCVICKDVLYSVAELTYMYEVLGTREPLHGVVAYNLSQWRQKQSLAKSMVLVPCAFTCAQLLNLNDKLILVGGIMKQYEMMQLETIGIWEMCGNGWKEIARAPFDVLQHFDVSPPSSFMSSGYGNLIFFQSYTSRALLIYEFCNDIWKFVPKPPIASKYNGFEIFGGFCFEPRIDIVP